MGRDNAALKLTGKHCRCTVIGCPTLFGAASIGGKAILRFFGVLVNARSHDDLHRLCEHISIIVGLTSCVCALRPRRIADAFNAA